MNGQNVQALELNLALVWASYACQRLAEEVADHVGQYGVLIQVGQVGIFVLLLFLLFDFFLLGGGLFLRLLQLLNLHWAIQK